MQNILVTGAKGQLGSEIKLISETCHDYNFIFTDVEELDICDRSEVNRFVVDNKIDVIVNCAAYTAVDKAETDISKSEAINRDAVENLVDVCNALNVKLIHISTDYVFDGRACIPYSEADNVCPQGVYGRTKLEGEKIIMEKGREVVVIRTSWLYSIFGANFVKTVIRLTKERGAMNVIFDQVGTPTNAADLADAIVKIIPQMRNSKPEVYHYSNEGVCSWYDFAIAITEFAQIESSIEPIETKDYPTPARRPAYSVLNKSKIKSTFGLKIPYWRTSLKKCVERIK